MNQEQAEHLQHTLRVLITVVGDLRRVEPERILIEPSPISESPAKVIVLQLEPEFGAHGDYIRISSGEEPNTFYVAFHADHEGPAFVVTVPGTTTNTHVLIDALRLFVKGEMQGSW